MPIEITIVGDVKQNTSASKDKKCKYCHGPSKYHAKVRKKDEFDCVWTDCIWFCEDCNPNKYKGELK